MKISTDELCELIKWYEGEGFKRGMHIQHVCEQRETIERREVLPYRTDFRNASVGKIVLIRFTNIKKGFYGFAVSKVEEPIDEWSAGLEWWMEIPGQEEPEDANNS